MIQEVNIFSLESLNDESSILRANGVSTGTNLCGNFIEAQCQVNDKYLLFLSTDPINEIIRIYLLDSGMGVLDFIEIYASFPTVSGLVLERIKILNDTQIYFDFLTQKPWCLTILKKPTKRILRPWQPFFSHRPNTGWFDNVYMTLAHCRPL